MADGDQNRESTANNTGKDMPLAKTYSPRLEEFEEAIKRARSQFKQLPAWQRNNVIIKSRQVDKG